MQSLHMEYEFASILNFRDLGGHRTEHGIVETGMVFRSADLSNVTHRDIFRLNKLGVRHVIDLRYDNERKENFTKIS